MKKLLVLIPAFCLLFLAIPDQAKAQCPANAESNPCFSLPSGPCVTFPGGKFRFWIASGAIAKAKPYMDQEFNYSFWQYIQKYYGTDELSIDYMGGTWNSGQSFKVQMGGCITIVVIDPGI